MTQNSARVSKLLLQYQVAGQQQVLKANSSVTISLQEAEAAAKQLNTSVARLQELSGATIAAEPIRVNALRQANAQLNTAQNTQQRTLSTQQSITAEMERQAALGNQIAGSAAVRNRSLGQNVTQAGRALFNLPDIGGISTPISRGLILGGAAIDKFNISTAQLATAIPVAGVAMIGLAIAADFVRDASEAARDRQRRYGEALLEAAAAAETATRRQIEAQIDALEEDNRIKQRAIDDTLELAGVTEEFLQSLSRTEAFDFSFAGFVTNLLAGQTGIAENAEQVKEWSGDIRQNAFLIDVLRGIIDEGGTAASDAAVRFQELADAIDATAIIEEINRTREAADRRALQLLQEASQQQVEYAELVRSGTAEQVQDRLAAIQATQAATEQEIGQIEAIRSQLTKAGLELPQLYQDRLNELRADLGNLGDEFGTLNNRILPLLIAQEQYAERIDQTRELLEQEAKARDDLAEIQVRIAEIEAERIARIEEIRTETEDRLKEIGEDNAEARIKIEEDAAKRIRQINRDAKRDTEIATAQRDVLAFTLAQMRQKDALEEERESYEERLKDLEEALEDARKAELKALERRTRQIEDQAAKQVRSQEQLAARLQHIITTSMTSQEFLAATTATRVLSEQTKMYTSMEQTAFDWGQRVNASLQAGLGGTPGGGGGSKFPPLILPPGGQPGDDPGRYNTTRAFSAPTTERAFSQTSGASGGSAGGINISFTVEGADEERVMARVRTAFRQAKQQLNAGG